MQHTPTIRGARAGYVHLATLVVMVSLLLIPTLAAAQDPCVEPDVGGGTVTLPPPGCEYLSPSEFHAIIDGLPPGTTIEIDPIHSNFINIQTAPGGRLGGEVEIFDSQIILQMRGTGDLFGYFREIIMPLACEAHTGPRLPGEPVQAFENEMFILEGELFGDPDFESLTVAGGAALGLPPSLGQTILTDLGDGTFNVDSFFDITYRIDFVGAPGSPLDGMSGSTQGTVRMQAGEPYTPQADPIPTMTQWGWILLALVLLTAGIVMMRRRRTSLA